MFLCLCPTPNLRMLWTPGFEGGGKKYFTIAVDSVRTTSSPSTFLWGGDDT
jgi:hypothetical protein